jgi:DNA-binding NarL/FixJ family response regulator
VEYRDVMMTPDGAAHTPGLTPRQEQILTLIGEGLTNRQIGERLGVAEKTIKNSVTGLLACLNMQRRSQAAVYAALRRVAAAEPWPGAERVSTERAARR